MHKTAMEMGKWAMEKAKAHGFDNLTSQDWDDLKDCLESVNAAICADKDYRIVEAMDGAEQEDKFYGRMGYDRYRYKNGRFAPKGHGRRMGYFPYVHDSLPLIEDEDYYDYDEIPYLMTGYRMGYTPGKDMRGVDWRSSGKMKREDGIYDHDNMMHRPSRYGESYERYSDRRRHYHESGDADSKKRMEESIGEVFDDMENVVQDVWKEMTPEQKQKYKQRMTQMVQKMQ